MIHCKTAIYSRILPVMFLIGGQAVAQDLKVPPTLTFSGSLTGFSQGLVSGDGNKGFEFGGKFSGSVLVNGGAIGLWPGFFVNANLEHSFGDDVNTKGDGTLIPLNTALAFPTLGGNDTEFSLTFTQVFSKSTSFTVGKFNMLSAVEKTPLIGGGGVTSFQNMGLAAPISGVTPPYVLGALLSVKTEPVEHGLFIYDPRNAQDNDVLEHPFDDGVTISYSATFPTSSNGLPGFHSVRLVHSTQDGFDLTSLPQLALPPQSSPILGTKEGYYYASYSFQQYLEMFDDKKGWGVFGQVAVSDGNPNPIEASVILGLGGDSPINARHNDRWGVGYFRYFFSDDLVGGLSALGIGLRDEWGVEAYYDFAITDNFSLGLNVQSIRPGIPGQDQAVFAGVKARLTF